MIQTYAAAATANTKRKSIKPNVSKLLAVTRLTPNKIVLNSFPCDVLNPVLKTYATQPLSCAVTNKNTYNFWCYILLKTYKLITICYGYWCIKSIDYWCHLKPQYFCVKKSPTAVTLHRDIIFCVFLAHLHVLTDLFKAI